MPYRAGIRFTESTLFSLESAPCFVSVLWPWSASSAQPAPTRNLVPTAHVPSTPMLWRFMRLRLSPRSLVLHCASLAVTMASARLPVIAPHALTASAPFTTSASVPRALLWRLPRRPRKWPSINPRFSRTRFNATAPRFTLMPPDDEPSEAGSRAVAVEQVVERAVVVVAKP